MSDHQVIVEICEAETGEVVERFGPMSDHKAQKVDAGISINLNHERFYTQIVLVPEVKQ